MIERTSLKIYPILVQVLKKMIPETNKETASGTINKTEEGFNLKTTVSPIFTN